MKSSYNDVGDHLRNLPLLPGVITKMLALDRDDDDYFRQILPLAQDDPSLALRIIKLSNSAAFMGASPANTLEVALTRLGAYQIAALVSSLAVLKVFIPTPGNSRSLWQHSIQVALIARDIAKLDSAINVDPNEAYLCGLLHDVGRLIMFEIATDDATSIEKEEWDTPELLIDAEMKVAGITHAELGYKVCKKWGLPEHISVVVKYHHTMNLQKVLSIGTVERKLIDVVQIADALSLLMLFGHDLDSMPQNELTTLIQNQVIDKCDKTVSVTAIQLAEMTEKVISDSIDHCTALGLNVHQQ